LSSSETWSLNDRGVISVVIHWSGPISFIFNPILATWSESLAKDPYKRNIPDSVLILPYRVSVESFLEIELLSMRNLQAQNHNDTCDLLTNYEVCNPRYLIIFATEFCFISKSSVIFCNLRRHMVILSIVDLLSLTIVGAVRDQQYKEFNIIFQI